MISRHADWQSLIDTLRLRVPSLADVPIPVTSAVLAGPCAIAWWIAARAPALAEGESLSLLIVGAETTDVPDEARWYQLLALLLDRDFPVQVTLVGLELDSAFASSAAAHAPSLPASAHRKSLAGFLADHGNAPIDLAFVFHPGLQKHRGWLERSGFPMLLSRAIPLVCAAYEMDEYEMERWVVEAYGYGASVAPLLNPFFLDLSDEKTTTRWGRVLWQIETAPHASATPDPRRLASLDTLNRMVLHSMTLNISSPGCGIPVDLCASTGAAIKLVHVFDNRYLDARTREIVLLDKGKLTSLKRLPAEENASYPGDDAREIERAMWAASIKERYLLDTYPEVAPPGASQVAAGMLATLKRKAAALFRSGK